MRWIPLLALCVILTGCAEPTTQVLEISQAKSISLPTVNADTGSSRTRVVALANGSAEIIAALGLKKILIGRDIASTEKSLQNIPIVTAGHQVVVEKILSLQPDLLLVDNTTGPKQAIDQLRKLNIPITSIDEAWSIKEIESKISAVARAIGAQENGAKLNELLKAEIDLKRKLTEAPKVLFLYLRGSNAIYLVGGKGSGADSMINAAGGLDIGAEELSRPFTPLTSEALIALNPDIFLVMTKGLASVGGMQGLLKLPGVAQTKAGKRGAVIAVDDSLLLSFGPRTPDLVRQLHENFYTVMRR